MSTYRERRLDRAARLRDWAEKRAARADGNFRRAHDLVKDIPLGQPILVGHHSERRHRRTLEKSDNAMRRGCEDQHKAGEMESRADNIEDAADRAIYRDDPDAIERLTAKLADLEAQRAAMKQTNTIIRNKKLTPEEKIRQIQACGLSERNAHRALTPDYMGRLGFPAYAFSNLSGTITKERKRLAEIIAAKTTRGTATIHPDAQTAIARAGLVITATMTTPAKAWKQPRPVWNVTGNLAFWRPLLEQIGGSWYRGVVSFWDDPTTEIEAAIQEAETRDQARGFALEVPADV